MVDVETHKQDRYGRSVGKVIHQGRDVNLEQVRRGIAWHYKAYEREQASEDRASYARVEVEARDAHLGLWSHPIPIPPWDWRKQRKRIQ
jgi:endonuclease YncB( thermonuclease family)